jgi:hypothetical protein
MIQRGPWRQVENWTSCSWGFSDQEHPECVAHVRIWVQNSCVLKIVNDLVHQVGTRCSQKIRCRILWWWQMDSLRQFPLQLGPEAEYPEQWLEQKLTRSESVGKADQWGLWSMSLVRCLVPGRKVPVLMLHPRAHWWHLYITRDEL